MGDLNGKNYRLLKSPLEHDILPDKSRFIVKKNKVLIKMEKKKGDYSYEQWQNLVSKKSKEEQRKRKEDPMGGIMDMMKDMYEDGDANTKKMIAEAMIKSRSGEKPGMPGMPSGMDNMDI